MDDVLEGGSPIHDFRRKSTLGLTAVVVFLLMPFAINNFVQGRWVVGIVSMMVVAIASFNGWSVTRERYHPGLTMFALAPAIIIALTLALRDPTVGYLAAMWAYPAIVSFYIILPERHARIANVALLAVLIPQTWSLVEPAFVLRLTATLFAVSLFTAIFIRVITEQQSMLERIASTDPLTGLLNRNKLQGTLEQSVRQNRRSGVPFTLLAVDLDHFKSINDSLGHAAGDKVLREVGGLLQQRLRKSDRAFRMGGEEFLVWLYDTQQASAMMLAEELRHAMEKSELLPSRTVTASIGVATLNTDEDCSGWMSRVDANLYQAKTAGRNRVIG